MVYVAFVIDAYSRRVLGWRAATSMRTSLVLDALEHAVTTRREQSVDEFDELLHHLRRLVQPRRMHSTCGDIPPGELEAAHHRQLRPHPATVHPSP